ncbi:biotin/lipoyl-binding protein [Mycoplasma miroungirhinis]|uniref:Biotin/lipoyl-binding protein n=1 Tax=Mycoplasma miroungirhinis TaxID=754516 RepID=A0A6M4JBI7_9MOLU|nr:biotin/lipoyl-containing protein [Mycoplasma miroungirhinis]QJR44280.1 biotin/lipoyl-binding protein [Mycoplasma miroungirhinis]
MFQMKFTDVGEGLHEGTIAEVYVTEGQEVKEGDNLYSVETDKMTTDIPAPVTGKIAKILIEPGKEVTIGDVVFEIEES